ncbi:MAG: preprotein translocase subunit SecA, partial [Candidatus Paceibacterota bacterium]
MSIITKIFGDPNEREIKKLKPIVEQIGIFENELVNLSNDDLKKEADKLKEKLKNGASLDDILPRAFALVRESGKRTLGQRHFDVQLIGGIVLHQGKIAEMRTGEGKTLSATLPAFLNSLTKEGVHIITVNDYLAKRDAVWMGQIYDLLGISVSCVVHDGSFLYSSAEKEKDKERDIKGGFKVLEDFLLPVS